MYAYVYVHVHVHVCVRVSASVSVRATGSGSVCVCVRASSCASVCVSPYAHGHVSVHVHAWQADDEDERTDSRFPARLDGQPMTLTRLLVAVRALLRPLEGGELEWDAAWADAARQDNSGRMVAGVHEDAV